MRLEAFERSHNPMSHKPVNPSSRRRSSSGSGIWSRRVIGYPYCFVSWSSHTRTVFAIKITFGIHSLSGLNLSYSFMRFSNEYGTMSGRSPPPNPCQLAFSSSLIASIPVKMRLSHSPRNLSQYFWMYSS